MVSFVKSIIFSFLIATPLFSLASLSWTPEAMMSLQELSDPQLSPDHQSILFVATKAQLTEKKGVYLSQIYKASTSDQQETPLFFKEETSSTHPRWSPDGKWIAFISDRAGVKNLYLIPSEGGEVFSLTKGKEDIQTFAWSPDGKKIAFVMKHEIEIPKNKTKPSKSYTYEENLKINQLWMVDISSKNTISLTSDKYNVRGSETLNTEFDWSPDSKEIIFSYSPENNIDSFYLDSSLATINLDSQAITLIEKKARYEALPRYSPDGTWIAYISSNSLKGYAKDREVCLYNPSTKESRKLSPTREEGTLLLGPNLLGWSQDGSHILFFEPKETKFHLVLLPINGTFAKEIETDDLFFNSPSLSPDKTMLSFVMQTPSTPPEVFITKIDNFSPIKISSLNDSLLSYPKTKTEIISWTSQDGLNIEGLLTYPVVYEKEKKYPLLLSIHGGPAWFFDETFIGTPDTYPLACLAQEGFFIFRPNPRGSCGYGKQFRGANYRDWGGMDFLDILSGVDFLINKGFVDPERLGIMGWSYGGYMTAWTISQTERFKAASIGAGVYNLISMNGTTDLHRFLTDYLGKFPDQRELYENRSPLYHVSNIKTPCLIQHGTADTRVPITQAYELYHALKREGAKPILTLYPETGHSFSDPNLLLECMKENLSWFQLHLNSIPDSKNEEIF